MQPIDHNYKVEAPIPIFGLLLHAIKTPKNEQYEYSNVSSMDHIHNILRIHLDHKVVLNVILYFSL